MKALSEFKRRYGAQVMAVQFIANNMDQFLAVSSYACDHFDGDGGPLKFSITNSGNRTVSQNALLWMWYTELAHQIKERGKGDYSSEDLHEYFKDEYCPAKVIIFGKKHKRVKSTKKLEPGEMMIYLNEVERWSKNAGFKLTDPIKSEYRDLMERNS